MGMSDAHPVVSICLLIAAVHFFVFLQFHSDSGNGTRVSSDNDSTDDHNNDKNHHHNDKNHHDHDNNDHSADNSNWEASVTACPIGSAALMTSDKFGCTETTEDEECEVNVSDTESETPEVISKGMQAVMNCVRWIIEDRVIQLDMF